VTLFGVRALSIGVGGLPGILAIMPKYYLIFFVGMLIAIVVPFLLTLVFRRIGLFNKIDRVGEAISPIDPTLVESATTTDSANLVNEEIYAPLNGKLFPLSHAMDPVFSQGTMGQGMVIEPSEGAVYAPMSGTISLLFPSKHAVGLIDEQGVELLIHVGMDTVQLNGEHFTAFVKQGDSVTRGQKLLAFDIAAIQKAGYPTQTPVIITNSGDYQVDPLMETGEVTIKQAIMRVQSRE
jgi:PTS system trehalose-specific IIC component